jgi:hypothetical protein
MVNKKEYDFEKLWVDYLELCDSYNEEMPVYEFGYGMIRCVSRMMFDTAPSEMVARETIRLGIEAGRKWSNDEKCSCE